MSFQDIPKARHKIEHYRAKHLTIEPHCASLALVFTLESIAESMALRRNNKNKRNYKTTTRRQIYLRPSEAPQKKPTDDSQFLLDDAEVHQHLLVHHSQS